MKNRLLAILLCSLTACSYGGDATVLSGGNAIGGPASAIIDLRASRSFAGPTQFPPSGFAGYGIVVFPTNPTSSQERFMMICRAYLAAISPIAALRRSRVPESAQMVTVMPVSTDELADELNADENSDDVCKEALSNYDLVRAQNAIKKAEDAADLTDGLQSLSGRGPFLLAWSPGQSFGSDDVLVLAADLSNTSTPEQAISDMRTWRRDIEQDPNQWRRGWNIEGIRLLAQRWVDRRGDAIIKLIGNWS